MKRCSSLVGVLALTVGLATALPAAVDAADATSRTLAAGDLASLSWRGIGPARMGGRVAALAWVPGSTTSFYVGYAIGGLFRTDDLGITFTPVFDHQAVSSIGAVEAADAPPDWPGWTEIESTGEESPRTRSRVERGRGLIVWVGTGEGNNRNSSSWGNGVYRSIDGGKTFAHVGLAESHDIPALAVDPRNPDVAYVAALGHLWGANPERGLYKTTDGGRSWQAVLRADADTGACDVVLEPGRPDTVYAALYARRRTPWSYQGISTAGGIFRSDDGGATWRELRAGLPERTGRIGLAVAASDPKVVYAVVESDQGGIGTSAWDDRSPAGGLFRSEDRGEHWVRVSDLSFRPFYFSRVAVDPGNPDRVYVLGWDLTVSDDGGRTLKRLGGGGEVHVDHHAIAINPQDPQRVLVANDGGAYLSHDRGAHWRHLATVAAGQFYHVAVDLSDPYRVGGGLQDNGSWIGPSGTLEVVEGESGKNMGILDRDWRYVFGGDGFRVAFDPGDHDVVYANSQGGELARINLRTKVVERLRPAADEGQERLRFNWDAPYLISHFDPSVLYLGGNRVFKLTHRGRYWYAISPDLSRRQTDRIMTEGSEAETYGTVVALAESPVRQGVLWAGTDDGKVHLTTDDGRSWKDVTPARVDGHWVSCIEPSHRDAGTAYVAVDGHRSDLFRPLLLRTTDDGASWTDITGDLPSDAPVRVVREHPGNTDVLVGGTEFGVFLSVDGGQHWVRLNGESLPTVPVYDLVFHPREGDLVAATHGRSVYILDDAWFLGQLTPASLASPLHLFPLREARPRLFAERGYGEGSAVFRAPNPPMGAVVTYWLREQSTDGVRVRIEDAQGHTVRTLAGGTRGGVNRVVWDLQAEKEQRFSFPGAQTQFVPPGEYTVVVTSGELEERGKVQVAPAPNLRTPEEMAFIPPPTPYDHS